MRSAGTIGDKLHARRFADYLLTRGISTRLGDGAEGFTVWVHDEERLAEVRAELPRFLSAPEEPRYEVGREAASLRAQAREEAAKAEAAARVVASASTVPAVGRVGLMGTPLTLALVAFCLVVAVYTQLGSTESPRLAQLTIATIRRIDIGHIGWFGLSEIASGEVWRLITPCFIHFGLAHLVMDMAALIYFGRQIEAARGTLRLAALVVLIGVGSNYGQYLVSGPSFGGMSGVAYGLLGYLVVMSRWAPRAGMLLEPRVALSGAIWFVVCLTGAIGPVANTAHGAGFVLGACFGGFGVWLHERRGG